VNVELSPLPEVTCHPAQINQLVMNLVAQRHLRLQRRRRVTVRTTAERRRRGGDPCLDNSTGIEPATCRRSLTVLHDQTGRPGNGPGLSISHQIVEDHGGTITVTSKVGEGTHFTVLLPLRGSRGVRK